MGQMGLDLDAYAVGAVGVMMYRFGQRQAQREVLKLLHSRWQEISRSISERPCIQCQPRDVRFTSKSDDEIVLHNFMFQILNLSYEAHYAANLGLVDRASAEAVISGNVAVLSGRRHDVIEMLGWERGYDRQFCDDMKRRLIALR